MVSYHFPGLDQWYTTGADTSAFDAAQDNAPKLPYSLYGDRIHISAEYINVDGILQSGRDAYHLAINNAALQEALGAVSGGQGGRIFLKETSIRNPGFGVYYDAIRQRFEVEELKTSGGYIEMFGRVLNTGYGDIRVLGGYSSIRIDNTTALDVVINRLDVSERGAGTLVIMDRAGGSPVAEDKSEVGSDPYASIYRWTPGGIVLTTNGGTTSATEILTTVPSISEYQPADGWRYGWTTVVESSTITERYYKSGKWLGLVGDVFQKDYLKSTRTISNGTPYYAGSGPYYYLEEDPVKADLAYTYDRRVSQASDGAEYAYRHNDYWTWYGSHVYEAWTREIDGYQTYHDHTVDAHRPISITFIGQAEGGITVNSLGGGSVLLAGSLVNPTGVTAINTNEAIAAIGGDAVVGGRRIDLSAGTGIGSAANPLLTDVAGMRATFRSTDGVQALNTPEYKFESTAGTRTMATYDTVRLADSYDTAQGKPGAVYQYIGPAESRNLSSQNYYAKSTWKEVFAFTEDVVEANGAYYRYIGTAAKRDLGAQNYADTSLWRPVTSRPSLEATTSAGAVVLSEIAGDLPVDEISSAAGGSVTVYSAGALVVGQQDNVTWYQGLVSGGSIKLEAGTGGIGTSALHPLALDSGIVPAGVTVPDGSLAVTARALGDVYLREVAGDLWLNQLVTTGAARIEVPYGGLYDANTERIVDERSRDILLGTVWADLQLTDTTGGNTKEAKAIESLVLAKQFEYKTYWDSRIRRVDTDHMGLADNQTYYLVIDEANPGLIRLAASLADAQAATPVVVDLTASDLMRAGHVLSSVAGSAFAFSYTFDSTTDVDGADETIRIPAGPGLTTGTAVRYTRTGITYNKEFRAYDPADTLILSAAELQFYTDYYTAQNLTPAQVSAAIATLENSRTTQYHTLHAQFAAYFAGRGKSFPDAYDPAFVYVPTAGQLGTIHQGIKVWTEQELLSLVGAGLLKSVTDTQVDDEKPNIVATNVVLDVAGSVGKTSGETPILLDGHEFTEAERLAMAAAERADVVYLAGAAIPATVISRRRRRPSRGRTAETGAALPRAHDPRRGKYRERDRGARVLHGAIGGRQPTHAWRGRRARGGVGQGREHRPDRRRPEVRGASDGDRAGHVPEQRVQQHGAGGGFDHPRRRRQLGGRRLRGRVAASDPGRDRQRDDAGTVLPGRGRHRRGPHVVLRRRADGRGHRRNRQYRPGPFAGDHARSSSITPTT